MPEVGSCRIISSQRKRGKEANHFPLASASPAETACLTSPAVAGTLLVKAAVSTQSPRFQALASPAPGQGVSCRASARGQLSPVTRLFLQGSVWVSQAPGPGGMWFWKVPWRTGDLPALQ